ncbi:glycosyltransferase family 2 protein [Staphylococcus xylosus]|uniref:glycosyltransferase family 2 protein n=1 Tax=Staphylococcus xylosus TaxID=1288 RepID=UPI000344C96C|nr:glycosyltransferase family 2 protein [Staphylococcus xylosus]NQD99342.1 glycosyltransferase [Staphylococcus xylosus]
MEFSIIVPSYNSEKYIGELLNSLQNQKYDKKDFEVILIDDCSTDHTLEIVESYKNKLNLTVKQLEANSGGPGKPRNTALNLAKGEYVFFVDSDDYIHPDTLKDVSKFVEGNQADVVLVKMEGVNGRGVPKSMFKETNDDVTLANSRIIYTLSPTKFYRTSLLRDNHIEFPEDLRSAEDQLFTMKAYVNAKKIAVLADKPYYYATKREGEHMSSAYVSPKDFYKVMGLITEEILNSPLDNRHDILGYFLDRHFSFSRTNNFSLKIADDKKEDWMDALGDFIQKVPTEVDDIVRDSLKPLLYYARKKDMKHYQIVEESFNNGQFYNFSAQQGVLQIQFDREEPYFIFNKLMKPDIRMTHFKFNEQGFELELEFLSSIINPNHVASMIQLKLVSRNKKELIYIPLAINDQTRFKFNASMKDIMPYLIKEKVWDAFLEMRVDNMSVEKRIGGKRLKYSYGKETSTIASLNDNYYRFTPYFTKDFDNLSFYVTQNKLDDMIEVTIKDSKTIQLSSLEFNYILSEGLTTVLLPDTFMYGYLTAHQSKEKMTYNIALNDKIKAKNLKKNFTLESPYFNLRY